MKISNLLSYRKANAILGVDISRTAINLLELCCYKQKFYVTNFVHSKLPVAMWQEKTMANKDLLITSLQMALQQQKIKTRMAVMAMPDSQVMSKQIQLDQSLSEKEIYEHLLLQKNQYLSNAAEELCWDFARVGISKNNSKQQDIQLVAVRKNILQEHVAILEAAGLIVKIVDVESFALARIGNFLHLAENTVLVHAHAYGLLWGVFTEKKLQYVQEKHWHNTQQDPSLLAAEIIQQLQLLEAIDHHLAPQQIYLSGYDIPISELKESLQRQSNLPITITNPFTNMLLADEKIIPADKLSALVLSCGLALWDFI